MQFFKRKFLIHTIFLFSIQILISSIIVFFYPDDLILGAGQTSLNPTLYLSILYIILSILATLFYNLKIVQSCRGFYFGVITIILQIALILEKRTLNLAFLPPKFKDMIITYSFSHLAGFRELIITTFGFDLFMNFFFVFNISIIIHLSGFLLGDLICLIILKKKNTKAFC